MCGSSGRFDKKHDGCYSWTRFVRTARGRRECGKSCMRNFHGDFSWDDDFFGFWEMPPVYIGSELSQVRLWKLKFWTQKKMISFFNRVIFSDVPFESSTKNHGERCFFHAGIFSSILYRPCWVDVEHSSSNPKKKNDLGSLGFLEVVGVKKGVLGWIIFDI